MVDFRVTVSNDLATVYSRAPGIKANKFYKITSIVTLHWYAQHVDFFLF